MNPPVMAARKSAPLGLGPVRPSARRRARRRGQVLIIALLAITMLVGLVVYVYNVGEQVNRRLALQNAADAVVISGAGWMARTMNDVAMNNVTQSRMIGMVPILDALPLATKMSYEETNAWLQGDGDSSLNAQVTNLATALDKDLVRLRAGLSALQGRMQQQRDILSAANNVLNGGAFRMEETTTWLVRGMGGSPPHGKLWQGAVAMDEFSQAMAASCGLLAQSDAVRFGHDNGVDAGFMVPMIPVLPAQRGTFGDFQPTLQGKAMVIFPDPPPGFAGAEGLTPNPPANSGGLGGVIPGMAYHYCLGPWARLFHFRDDIWWYPPGWGGPAPERPGEQGSFGMTGPRGDGTALAGAFDQAGGGFAPSFSPPPRRQAGWALRQAEGSDSVRLVAFQAVPTQPVVVGYRPFGPFEWGLRQARSYATGDPFRRLSPLEPTSAPPNLPVSYRRQGNLCETRWGRYENDQSKIKLSYMFAPPAQLTAVEYPQWVTDYAKARQLAANPLIRVRHTKFYVVTLESFRPESAANFLQPGTIFSENFDYAMHLPSEGLAWYNGWRDPEDIVKNYQGRGYLVTQVGGHPIWKIKVPDASPIGWYQPNPADPTTRVPLWGFRYFVFAGIDVGGEMEVANPANWDPRDHLPAPLLLDDSQTAYNPNFDVGDRRTAFAFLGLAKKTTEPTIWPQRFGSGNPSGANVTMAQAKLFNNTSWDLWTQDWQVQLAPVTQWDNWMTALDSAVKEAGQTNGLVDQQQAQSIQQYLSRIDKKLADLYLSH